MAFLINQFQGVLYEKQKFMAGYSTDSYHYLGSSKDEVLPVSFKDHKIVIYIYYSVDPNVDIILSLQNQLWRKRVDGTYDYNYDSPIPENIPNGTIMATIRNFSISLVEDGK